MKKLGMRDMKPHLGKDDKLGDYPGVSLSVNEYYYIVELFGNRVQWRGTYPSEIKEIDSR